MHLPSSDRALRRLAADLAAMHEEDTAAILADLSTGEREAIQSLLREFVSAPEMVSPPSMKECDYAQLSPWLADCVRNRREMTGEAHRTLRDCAVELFPPSNEVRSGPGLFARVATRALSIISAGR